MRFIRPEDDLESVQPAFARRCLLRLQGHRFIHFLLAGAVNAIVTYLLYLLLLCILSYPIAYTATYIPGIFLSYYLNARFVFKKDLSLSTALQYPIVYIFQYVSGMVLLYVFVELAHVTKVFAPVLIVFVTVPITYLLSRYIILRAC